MAISIAVSLHQPSLPLPYRANPIQSEVEEEPSSPVTITTHNVKATIIVKLTKPVKVASLSARFVSRQWLEDDNEEKCGTFGLYSSTKLLLEKSERECKMMPAGLHTFETSFDLPSWLPPTFSSSTSKMTHLVIAKLETPSPLYFNFRRNSRVAVQELVVIREPPAALNALRYWSGERRSAGTSLAIKTARFGRVDGKLKVSMRVKSLDQLSVCDVDIVQEESCCTDLPSGSAWHKLPGSNTSENTQILPFLGCQEPDCGAFTIRRYPISTISTIFPAPENEGHPPESATLSQLSLLFKLSGHDLRPNFTSPLLTVRHKLRIRFRFQSASSKEIVVNIPISLYEGPASCDDIPPLYEDIYSSLGRRSGASSVATLPLYVKDEEDTTQTDVEGDDAHGDESADLTHPEACGPIVPSETTLGLRLSQTFTASEIGAQSSAPTECLATLGADGGSALTRRSSETSWIDADVRMAPSVLAVS